MNQWVTNFKSIKTASGNPFKEGSRFYLIVEDQVKKYILDQTVISVKENELYSVRFENDVWVNNTTYTFKSEPDGTLIRAEVIVEGKGIIMKSIFTLMKRMFNAGLQTSLNKLRITFEQYE